MVFACDGVLVGNAEGKSSKKIGVGNQTRWHPKKNQVFYSYGMSGKWMIVNYDLDLQKESILFSNQGFIKFFDVSPNGDELLFNIEMQEHPYHSELYSYNYLTKKKKKIYSNNDGIIRACWNANGNHIYIAIRTDTKDRNLVEYDLNAKGLRTLISTDTLIFGEMGILK